MKILITGGGGFIGKYLVEFLKETKNNISIFDNFSNSDLKLISSLKEEGINVFKGDITNFEEISEATKDQDIVIHLAAKISVEDSIKNPSETFLVNVDGTKNVLSSCKKNNIKKLIVSSSAAVYGEGQIDLKMSENSKTNPISPYGESKIRMEEEIKEYAEKNGINYIILRFFNIFGKGQTPEYAGVITKFLEKIKNNENLEIFGDGYQIRDFISIKDVVLSISKSLEYNENGIFNIASGRATTITELAKIMINLSKKKLDIEYLPPKKGDIKFSQADILSAKKKLKFIPKIELESGIKELLNVNGNT